jgi:hypothetical protein
MGDGFESRPEHPPHVPTEGNTMTREITIHLEPVDSDHVRVVFQVLHNFVVTNRATTGPVLFNLRLVKIVRELRQDPPEWFDIMGPEWKPTEFSGAPFGLEFTEPPVIHSTCC